MSARNYGMFDDRGQSFDSDRIAGTIFVILYALMIAVVMLILIAFTGVLSLAAPKSGPAFPLIGGAFASLLMIIVTISLGAHIFAALGVRQSRAWGFWATIILSILSLASSGGGTCLTLIPLIYSILRITGTYGPKPI